jgi:hypothetical protein
MYGFKEENKVNDRHWHSDVTFTDKKFGVHNSLAKIYKII